MKYLSICSGIEAASVAWDDLGWTPAAFAEVDTGASAVLAHRFGSNMPGEPLATNGVPNLGDMTRFQEWPDYAIDLLVGGTPCQDYSVAGKRLGMAGERGSLSLTYIEIAARYRPRWVVWENVPGVLSSHGGLDFARFLGDLSGQKISVPAGGWQNAGLVPGIADAYGLAYRVLDAQFTRTRRLPRAVPQRRRRVFVVGYLGDWRRAAAALFDAQSLRGDPPPRREAVQRAASTLAARTRGGGSLGTDFDCDGGLIAGLELGNQGSGGNVGWFPPQSPCRTLDTGHPPDVVTIASTGDVAHCLNAGGMGRQDYGTETMVAHSLRGEGFDAGEDGTGRGTPLVPVAVAFAQNQRGEVRTSAVSPPLTCGGGKPGEGYPAVQQGWAVRRLSPTECERLQGFPEGWTAVPNARGKPAADGPRYKQLGNSMATNCMEWIGERIALVEALA